MNRLKSAQKLYKIILAVGLLLLIFIFLNPMYDTLDKISQLGIYDSTAFFSVYEKKLCKGNVKKRAAHVTRSCPKGGIVTVRQGGRLGNQIWEYASVWAVAKRTGLEPYVPGCIRNTIDELFDNLSIPMFEEISHCPMRNAETVDSLDRWTSPNQSIILPIWVRLFEETVPYVGELPEEFKVRQNLLEQCQVILRAAALLSTKRTQTFVGVHVRRTDYLAYLRRTYHNRNITTANSTYFLRAMEVVEKKYKDAIFVVLSDDLTWCRKTFSSKNNVYIGRRNSAVLDMALMASCNHTIYDYGTYGEWGALLARGETIYFNLTVNSTAQMGKMLNWMTV